MRAPPAPAGSCRRNMSRRSATTASRRHPIGAGPYKFVSFTPGVELVLEAFDGYWRKTPSVKRLVLKVIPDEATRLAALKRGEIDIAYSIRGELAEELQHTPGLTLKPIVSPGTVLALFPRAVGPEIAVARSAGAAGRQPRDRPQGINQALTLGFSHHHQQRHSRQLRILLAAAGSRFTIRTRPSSCSPKPAFPMASMPGRSTATAPTPISARRW